MPFDTIKTRLHTMRPLPNGVLPYKGTWDCLMKIVKHECDKHKYANYGAFYTGG